MSFGTKPAALVSMTALDSMGSQNFELKRLKGQILPLLDLSTPTEPEQHCTQTVEFTLSAVI